MQLHRIMLLLLASIPNRTTTNDEDEKDWGRERALMQDQRGARDLSGPHFA
jgi:hypothetical protein